MTKITAAVALALLVVGCQQKPAPVTTTTQKDPKVAAIEDRIAKTTPAGKKAIDKAKSMKPEVNEQVSAKTLGEMEAHYEKEMGAYNITPIGWEASQKKAVGGEKGGRWKIVFDYFDYNKQLLAAEWELNEETNKLYPFEKANAPGFYEEPTAQGKKGKK
jgi:hypothetical protein